VFCKSFLSKLFPAKVLSKPHFFSASHARALIIARAKEERNVLKKCLKERAPRGERSPVVVEDDDDDDDDDDGV